MIQRIQSIYLFIVFCLMAILVFVSFYPSSFSFMSGFNAGYFAAVAISTIITIFLYNKRKLQIKLCYAVMFLLVLIYAINFIFDRQNLQIADFFQYSRLSFIFPFISLILVYLAIRGIKKDEKLVRSLDRLR